MRKLNVCFSILFIGLLSTSAAWSQPDSKVYYRYTNEDGVKVLEDRIPPEYVPRGYEVVSLTGEVIKTVPPAPSDEEAEELKEERREQAKRERYNAELKRRYSTVKDIRDAKRRNLAELQGNISILKGNLSSVRNQIRDLESRAARLERSGEQVPKDMLQKMATLKTEVLEIQAQIKQRQRQYDEVSDQFDQDIERFAEITGER